MLAEVPPKAFLNYILFDDNYVPYDFGYDQIGTEGAMPGTTSDKMSLVAKVSKPGYIYIYLSNENEVVQEVYFDDLAIKHVKGVAIQQNDYYPFGLTFNSYQRENAVDQNYQFNGKERQDELDLGWDDFGARMYMSDIGRWGVVDPLAPKYSHLSPYNFVENNPINIVDPDGRSGEPVIDKKNKTITVHSNIVMYGGAASADLAKSTAKDIQDKWNAAGGKVTVGGVEYSVQFSVTGSYNDKLTADDVSKNTDIRNNFIRVEESVEGGVSYMDDLGSNTGEFLLKNINRCMQLSRLSPPSMLTKSLSVFWPEFVMISFRVLLM